MGLMDPTKVNVGTATKSPAATPLQAVQGVAQRCLNGVRLRDGLRPSSWQVLAQNRPLIFGAEGHRIAAKPFGDFHHRWGYTLMGF